MGGGDPFLSEAPPSVQGCPQQGPRCRNPQRPALGGLLVCGAGGRAGAGASVHPRPQDISPSLPRLSRRQSQDTPGPEPHSSGTAPPLGPSVQLGPPPWALLHRFSFTFRRLGVWSPLATAGPAPPWVSTAPQPPQRPSRSQSQTQTPAPHGNPQPTPLQTKLLA